MKYIFAISLLTFLSACATPGPTSTVWYPDKGEALMMDAKQRLVINTTRDGQQIICAEPSPDVVTTLDTDFSTGAGVDLGIAGKAVGLTGVDGKISRSLDESSEATTNKTQAVTVLRDGLYRACEAYVNGLLGREEYGAILSAYDEILVALVAIDALQAAGNSSQDEKVQYQALKSTEQVVKDYYCMKIGGSRLARDPIVVERMCK